MLFKGIIPAVLTPFDKYEEVDYAVLREHIRRLLAAGVHGIFVLGTNGEFYALAEDEKCKIVETAVDEVNGKVPVYAGSGEIATRTVVRLSKAFKAIGVDAVSVITPYFINPSQHELYEHYKRIAAESDVPVILYNLPMRTHVNLEADTVGRLAEVGGIAGIKDSSGKMELVKEYIKAVPDGFSVLGGNDALILDTLVCGGCGAIAATANVIPYILIKIYDEFMKGNVEEARIWQDKVNPLRADFSLGTAPGVIKVQANAKGYGLGESRMPILFDDREVLDRIRTNLANNYTGAE
jgi:4-hydroxy-tetrahydrodipicolinate synthase